MFNQDNAPGLVSGICPSREGEGERQCQLSPNTFFKPLTTSIEFVRARLHHAIMNNVRVGYGDKVTIMVAKSLYPTLIIKSNPQMSYECMFRKQVQSQFSPQNTENVYENF